MALALAPGQSRDAAVWDAEFELWLASAISRRLAEKPPPRDAIYPDSAQEWAENLGSAGREALEELGEPQVRPVA